MTRKNFTIIELLLVISIIVILASMLFPALTKARMKSKQIDCINKLKQLGTVCSVYSVDYEGWIPPLQGVITEVAAWSQASLAGTLPVRQGWACLYYQTSPAAPTIPGLYCPEVNISQLSSFGCFGLNVRMSYFAAWSTRPHISWHKYSQIKKPSAVLSATDVQYNGSDSASRYCSDPDSPDFLAFRHLGRCNTAWIDGHADSQRAIASAMFKDL